MLGSDVGADGALDLMTTPHPFGGALCDVGSPGCPRSRGSAPSRPRVAGLPARDEAGPLARYASTIQAQRHDYNGKVLSIRAEDLKSLAIIYDMSPDELTSRLIEWGVLSPGMESVVGFGGSDDDDEALDPHWERRRSPR